MRHGVDSQETLGKLGLPRSGDLLAEGKLAKTFWEVMSMHLVSRKNGLVVVFLVFSVIVLF